MATPNISRDNSVSSFDSDSELYEHDTFKNEQAGIGVSNIMATNSSMYCLLSYVYRAS